MRVTSQMAGTASEMYLVSRSVRMSLISESACASLKLRSFFTKEVHFFISASAAWACQRLGLGRRCGCARLGAGAAGGAHRP